MNIAEIAVRAVSYAASMLMFGASLFVLYAPGAGRSDAHDGPARSSYPLCGDVRRLQVTCAVTTIVATLLWLAIHSADVAGLPFSQALSSGAPREILAATLFGRAMTWHIVFAAALI